MGSYGGDLIREARRRAGLTQQELASRADTAQPAIAQGAIKWRLASSFPKSLDGLWGASPTIAKFVNEMSDGKFTIDPFAAGEIVPGLQVLDAVANGTVECGHSYGGYYIGKNSTLIFDGSLPFGMTPRQQNAWYLYGDGKKLMDEVYDGMGVGQHSDRKYRRADLRLVPEGDEVTSRFQRHQDARCGFRREGTVEARRGPATDRCR